MIVYLFSLLYAASRQVEDIEINLNDYLAQIRHLTDTYTLLNSTKS